MEEASIPVRDQANDLAQLFQAQYAAPAYIRRARRVEDAWNEVIERCRRRRDEWLLMVKLRLGTLVVLAGPQLRDVLDEDSVRAVLAWHAELQPDLKAPPAPTMSIKVLRRAVDKLNESSLRFNQRWPGYVETVDLGDVNRLRADYNRYYLLEKECALRSPRLARIGYRPLEPLTPADVLAGLPLLPILTVRPS